MVEVEKVSKLATKVVVAKAVTKVVAANPLHSTTSAAAY